MLKLRPIAITVCLFLATATNLGAEETAAPTIDIPNAKSPTPGVLVGGQPSQSQLETAAISGFKTIVNLRGPGESEGWDEANFTRSLGLDYVTIPIAGASDLDAEAAHQLGKILQDPARKPVMVHCKSGNRVGALFALEAFHIGGADPDAALKIGLGAGLTSLQAEVENHLHRQPAKPSAKAESESSNE